MEYVKSAGRQIEGEWVLNPMDKTIMNLVIKGTWLFGGKPDLGMIKDSLSRLLDIYPQMSGRVRDKNRVVFSNEGVSYTVVRKEDKSLDDVANDKNVCDRYSTGLDIKSALKGEAPLLVITVTLLGDGYVVSAHCAHLCMDGSSFYTMMAAWGELSRGKTPTPPLLDQSIYPHTDGSISREEASRMAAAGGWKPVGFSSLLGRIRQLATRVDRHNSDAIHISDETISALRESLRDKCGESFGNHSLLSALMTKMALRLSGIKDTETCSVLTVADVRGKLGSVPANFCGNAVVNIPSADFPANASPHEIALAVDGPVRTLSSDPERLERYILLNLYAMEYKLPLVPFDLEGMSRRRPTTIYINNFSRFPMYGIDFGTGSPVKVFPHDLPDAIKIFPAANGEGVDIYLRGYLAKRYNKLGGKRADWLDNFLNSLTK